MSWQDLLTREETKTMPWLGGREVASATRRWRLRGQPPAEHGWHRFVVEGRRARWEGEELPPLDFERGRPLARGYLVGDRLIRDDFVGPPDVLGVFRGSERVHLVERGLPRFARVLAARWSGGALLFVREEFPMGPEPEAELAWEDGAEDLAGLREVPPALALTFAWLRWQERLAEERRQRIEEERRQREAAEAEAQALRQLLAEERERRAAIRARFRPQRAGADFSEAARAALAISGAELLSHREARGGGEQVVRFRFRAERFECVVRADDLRVVDSGICLENHATGERGDDRFTLESLPAVIAEAMDQGVLHRFRYA